jgi:hypothetical protein
MATADSGLSASAGFAEKNADGVRGGTIRDTQSKITQNSNSRPP